VTVRKRKRAEPKNRAVDDMQRFYRSLDLAALWTDFYVSIAPSGRPKYASARQFGRSIGENEKQKEFLAWIFGPALEANVASPYPFARPLEFDKKRDTGGWFSEDNLKEYSKDIRQQINALDALRSVGNGITVHSLARMEHLAQRLDEDFGGRFFVDGLSSKENLARAHAYLLMHEKLLHMIGEAQDIYAKSHGINFQDMSGFERLIAAQAMMLAAGSEAKTTRAGRVMDKIVEMVLEKSTKHGLQLPAEVEKVVVLEAGKERKKSIMM
jgi:hypothetical protein